MISIIGAGPAGSYTAYLLAKAGKEVEVFEEHERIGSPIQCSGVITPEIEKLISLKKEIVVNKIKRVRFHAPNGSSFDVPIRGDYVFDRGKFDEHLAGLAEKELEALREKIAVGLVKPKKEAVVFDEGKFKERMLDPKKRKP